MLGMQWHRLPVGNAADETRPENLSFALQEMRWQGSGNRGRQLRRPYVGSGVLFRSCATAVTSWAVANGLGKRTLLGTPLEAHCSAAAPVM